MIYLLLAASGFMLRRHSKGSQVFFIVWILVLYIFVAFRYEVGCDWYGYALHFDVADWFQIEDAAFSSEPAYWYIIHNIKMGGFEYPVVNVVLAIPFFTGMTLLARRQPDPLAFLILSFPVFIINMPMSGIRQAAAIGLVCFALLAFQDKRLIRYVVFVVLAGLFHKSALVFLAMAPFVIFPATRWTILASGILIMPSAYFLLADIFSVYSDRYVNALTDAAGAIYRSGMLALTGGLFMLVLRQRYAQQFPQDYQLALAGSLIMIATLPVVFVSTVIADRFGYYVMPIQLIILARIPYLIRSENKALISASPYLALGLVLIVWTNLSYHFNKCYLPYQNWLFWQS